MDEIEVFSATLIGLGILLALLGAIPILPAVVRGSVAEHAANWAPGLVIDGVLLWVVNGIIRKHERERTLSQVGSLSREFALDATRRAREEGWLGDGSMAGRSLARARLRGADLSGARFSHADLTFADLRGTTLAYADLRGADLSSADLRKADLRWADLTGAALRWADLRHALLDGAKLDGVDARFASVDERQAAEHPLAGAIPGGFLDEAQIREVRRTFEVIARRGTAPVERFYALLFERAPATRALFKADPAVQSRKFLQSLKVIVSALHAPRRHVPVLLTLGERHRGYGVRPEHFPLVGGILIDTFAAELGDAFTPSARASWQRACELIATVMMGADLRRSEAGSAPAAASSPAAREPLAAAG